MCWGAAGLSRAYEYCLAFPEAMVLVISVELCSLTFQHDDKTKSNLIGTSLFADGVACTCITGSHVNWKKRSKLSSLPRLLGTRSTFMKDSEDVMGWNIKNNGLYVVFLVTFPLLLKMVETTSNRFLKGIRP